MPQLDDALALLAKAAVERVWRLSEDEVEALVEKSLAAESALAALLIHVGHLAPA